MNNVEDSALLIVRNINMFASKHHDGDTLAFITSKGKIIAFRSDDEKAMGLYGPLGEVVPASEAEGEWDDFEIRDHRQDELTEMDVKADMQEA